MVLSSKKKIVDTVTVWCCAKCFCKIDLYLFFKSSNAKGRCYEIGYNPQIALHCLK